jgi:hypothetical protein
MHVTSTIKTKESRIVGCIGHPNDETAHYLQRCGPSFGAAEIAGLLDQAAIWLVLTFRDGGRELQSPDRNTYQQMLFAANMR